MEYSQPNLDNFTLIIPTFQKPHFAKRQLKYWSKTNINLHIVDGSPMPLYNIEDYLNENIHYHHMKNLSLEKRLGLSTDFISTKYSGLLADDGFFLPSGIVHSINDIKVNNLGVSKGQCYNFYYKSEQVIGYRSYKNLKSFNTTASTSYGRMIEHLCPYRMISLWSIMESELMKTIFRAIGRTGKLGSAACTEIQISLISSYLGHISGNDSLLLLKSYENSNIWWSEGKYAFHTWYEMEKFIDEKDHFLNITANEISISTGLEKDNILSDIEKALDNYSAFSKRFTAKKIKQRVLGYVKKFSPNYHSLLYDIMYNNSPDELKKNICKEISKSSFNEYEVDQIVEIINQFHIVKNN